MARDEETRLRRRQVVQIPAKLTSVGACMQAATNVSEIAKDEAEAITADLDAREKKDLDAAYGVVERGRRPREYSPALGALEKDQKTRAKRRILDVADRCLMDLTSVYRDAIALSVGAPGALVNEEMRAEIDGLTRQIDAGGAAADDRCDLHRARTDAGVQRAAAPGARVDDGGPAAARGDRPMKKILIWVVIAALVASMVAAAVVALSGSGSSDPDDAPSRSASTPRAPDTGSAPSPELEPFYGQQLDWSECDDDDFECATLEVPLNYSEPGGATIDLSILKVPASDDSQGSLVVNPGGPGAPGTLYAAAASRSFREPLLRAFDIVGFDPRGTGDSAPIDCLSDDQLDTYLSSDPNPDDAAEAKEFAGLIRELGRGCAELSGDEVNHVSTIEAARDMDVLRSALGEDKLTYLGASYGTKLGATYAELFPDRVGRLVLDGAVDVSLDNRQLGLEQAAGFETALRSYIQNCIDTTEDCFLGDTVDEGLATITGLLADVEETPLPAGDRDLQVGNAFYGIVTPLYNRDYWFLLSAALPLGPRRQRHGADAARRHLRLAGPGRLHRQQLRGDLRDQLPRRPVLDRLRQGGLGDPGLRGGLADLRLDLRLVADQLPRLQGQDDREADRDPRRGCRADPRRRHHPRPRHTDEVGRGAVRPAASPASCSAATATGTRRTTPATSASTPQSSPTSSTGTCRTTPRTADHPCALLSPHCNGGGFQCSRSSSCHIVGAVAAAVLVVPAPASAQASQAARRPVT